MAGTDPAARLRDASLRVTAQRTAVLQVLEHHPHSDAGFVARTVREGIGTVSLQAVYDVLAALSEVGIVRKFQPAGSPALFELRTGDNHHHVVCRTCGAVADTDCAVGGQPCLTPTATDGFVVQEAEVVFWGVCLSCADSVEPQRDPNTPPTTVKEPKWPSRKTPNR
ncbi:MULTISPECIES: Fur family transcriptional regulator [Streptomyces]|uniref:Fur family transcriptional regulator n=1 Tax=Streptomyces TaxID=1883 RepID=UPI0006645939|nr:Fur family transcriptional regulator [Streptomyces sp. NRRL WC-3744]